MKNICLLGATGSIGLQTCDIIKNHNDVFKLVAVSCNNSIDKMRTILNSFPSIKYACVSSFIKEELKKEYCNITFFDGENGLLDLIKESNTNFVVNALVGFVGLKPTVFTIENDIDIALANKESLVIGGELINSLLKNHISSHLYPIDSEHVALAKLLKNRDYNTINSLIITASGGSFRDLSRDELDKVTIKDALNHPSWSMGEKITIDSATMVNKAFEIIEAHYLFNFPPEKIKVLLHDESKVHSLILMNDNSFIADIGPCDMRIPIAYALFEGNYIKDDNLPKLDLESINGLHFRKLDKKRYPALDFAYRVIHEKGTLGACFNASNEACNEAFRSGKLPFNKIEYIIKTMMDSHRIIDNPTLEDLVYVHNSVYNETKEYIDKEKW